MDQVHLEYPKAYAPIPKGFLKEEPEETNMEENQEESVESSELDVNVDQQHQKYPLAYAPIPKGVIKEEPEDANIEGNQENWVENSDRDDTQMGPENTDHWEYAVKTYPISKGIVKDEPSSDGEDGAECQVVSYPPLPHGFIKEEESELEDGDNQIHSEVQPRQEGNHNAVNSLAGDADSGVPLTISSTAGIGNDIEPPRVNKRKRTPKDITSTVCKTSTTGYPSVGMLPSTSRAPRSRTKGSSILMTVDGVTSEERMEKCSTGKRAAKYHDEATEIKEQQSSLKGYSGDSSGNDLIVTHSTAGPSQSTKQNVVGKSKTKIHKNPVAQEKSYKCKNFGCCYKTELHLKRHVTRICGVKPQFSCQDCVHQFKMKQDLRRHLIKVHAVEISQLTAHGAGPKIKPAYPFQCEKCGKTYKHKYSLTKHVKYECEVDPSYSCTLCDYRGAKKSHLRNHLMSVHGICRSQFGSFGSAAPDVRPVHPFKCEKCEKTYKYKHGLNRHLKYQCGVDPSFPYLKCNYCATLKSNLKKHIASVHAAACLP